MARIGGDRGRALVGGRQAVTFVAWRGARHGNEWEIHARLEHVDEYWLQAGGGYVDLRCDYGHQVLRWPRAALGVEKDTGEVEAWATGQPEERRRNG